MIWEIYTFGGGRYLGEVFNAIAALTSGGAYLNVIKISALFGMIWALFEASFHGAFKPTVKWIASFMIVYNTMFLPKSTVLIYDCLDTNRPYQEVQNVPYALAVFASLSSKIGKELTSQMEAAFTPVDYLPYHEHGLLFGSKLIEISTSMKIADEDFASTISSFMRQCVFYDILLHRYSIDDLKVADDMWEFLSSRAAKSRSFVMLEKGQTEIRTCREGIAKLNEKWPAQIDKVANLFGKVAFKGKSKEEAKNLFLQYLPMSYSNLIGISKNASDLIKQTVLINSMDRAVKEFGGIYANAKASAQTKASFTASKSQAQEWVPILKTIIEVLFYGAFPLVFLLFLMPIGGQVAKGYFLSFIWLQSWGPLYAVLNLIMCGVASYKASYISEDGLTMMTQGGIAQIQESVSVMAGYLAWFIPFMAAGLAKGALSVTGLATSMLAVPQSATTNAASEVASGNLSLGASNLDSASYNSISGNKMNESAFFDGARIQAINSMGGITSVGPDGRTVYDQSGSVSRVPNLQMNTNDTMVQTAMQTANMYQNMGKHYATQASESWASAVDEMAQVMANTSSGNSSGVRFTEHASAEVREAYNRIEQEANELSRNQGIEKSTAFSLLMNGKAGLDSSFGATGSTSRKVNMPIDKEAISMADAKATSKSAKNTAAASTAEAVAASASAVTGANTTPIANAATSAIHAEAVTTTHESIAASTTTAATPSVTSEAIEASAVSEAAANNDVKPGKLSRLSDLFNSSKIGESIKSSKLTDSISSNEFKKLVKPPKLDNYIYPSGFNDPIDQDKSTTTTSRSLTKNRGFSFGFGLGAGINASADTKASTTYSENERSTKLRQLQRDVTTVQNAVMDRSIEFTNSHGASLNQSLAHNFSEAKRMEDQSKAYFEISKNLTDQAQLMRSKSVSFSQDKMPEFIEYAMSQPDLSGNPLGERALDILTHDPVQTERLKQNFAHKAGMNNTNFYNDYKDILQADNLVEQYISGRPEDNTIKLDPEAVKSTYRKLEKGSGNRYVNNHKLADNVPAKLAENRIELNKVQIDQAGVGEEAKNKLKDDAAVTRGKALLRSTNKEQPKTNFDNRKE